MRYKKGLSDDTVKIVLEYLHAMHPDRKRPKINKKSDSYFERFQERFYEIFPHPYHV